MKLFFILGLVFALHVPVSAGTYMIVVAELRPETTTKQSVDFLRQVIIDAIFDVLFESGHIAFDVPAATLNGWTPEWRLSHIREAARYGANRVVIIRIEWKAIGPERWDTEAVYWAVLDVRRQVELASGALNPNFFTENESEIIASQRITSELMKGLRVGLVQ